ncbi:MAG: S1 family peptidase, partial [Prochlorotrichaceae cyanobacterium]
MVLDQKRVAEIWVPSTSERGSGYVLCHGCVLTAYHVVKGSAQVQGQKDIDFRLLGDLTSGWLSAEILWKDEALDLALLQFTGNLSFAVPLPKLAPQDFNQRIDCNACGFPSFEVEKDYKKTVCQEYRAEGWIKPTDLTATKNTGRLLMEIEGAIPNGMTDWKGISGSAVFSTQGGLLGVILDGPENLQGQQIQLISLGWVLQNHPDFNDTLKNTFQQCLEFYNPIAAEARNRYLSELQIRQIEAQEVCAKVELADCQAMKERFSRDLDTLSPIDRHQLETCLAAVPEKELEQILETLNTGYPQSIREVWHHTAPSRLAKVSDIQSIHALLLGTKDSTLLSRFLSTLVHQLEKIDRPEILPYTEALTEIAQKLGQRLERDLIPQALQTQPQTATKEMGTTLILIKLKQISTANQSAEYSIEF